MKSLKSLISVWACFSYPEFLNTKHQRRLPSCSFFYVVLFSSILYFSILDKIGFLECQSNFIVIEIILCLLSPLLLCDIQIIPKRYEKSKKQVAYSRFSCRNSHINRLGICMECLYKTLNREIWVGLKRNSIHFQFSYIFFRDISSFFVTLS